MSHELKLECLRLAVAAQHSDAEGVVHSAGLFYSFVTGVSGNTEQASEAPRVTRGRKTKPAEKVEAAEPEAAEPEAAEPEAAEPEDVTKEQLQRKLKALMDATGREAVGMIVKNFGAANVSALCDAGNASAAYAIADAALAELGPEKGPADGPELVALLKRAGLK